MASRVFVVEEVVVDDQGRRVQGDRAEGAAPTNTTVGGSGRSAVQGYGRGHEGRAGTGCAMEAMCLGPVMQVQRSSSAVEAAGAYPQSGVQMVHEVYDVGRAATGLAAQPAELCRVHEAKHAGGADVWSGSGGPTRGGARVGGAAGTAAPARSAAGFVVETEVVDVCATVSSPMAATGQEVLVRPRLPVQRAAGRMPHGQTTLVPSAAPRVGGEALFEVATPADAGGWRRWSQRADHPEGEEQLVAAHRKKRRMPRTFSSAEEREDFEKREQAAALVPLLPDACLAALLGGGALEHTLAQVPHLERLQDMVVKRLLHRAGTEGKRLADVRGVLCGLRLYAQTVIGAPPGQEDAATWPVSAALAHEVIHAKHAAAVAAKAGSQGGATVGAHVCDTFLIMGEKLGLPIETEGAAPPLYLVGQKKFSPQTENFCEIRSVCC